MSTRKAVALCVLMVAAVMAATVWYNIVKGEECKPYLYDARRNACIQIIRENP